MNKEDMAKHVKILGWLHIVMGILFLIVGLIVSAFLIFGGVLSNDYDALTAFTIMAVFIGGLLTIIGLPGIIAGIGLLKRKNWGRILAIIVGLLNITNIPVGTAIGAYTAYILLMQETAPAFFEK
jgi:hypothetical protein